MRQALIGAILIGPGTSLPELALSVGALIKKRPGISVGNLIGSNVFDTLVPIGVGAVISAVHVDPAVLRFDLPCLLVVSLTGLWFLTRGSGVGRVGSLVLIGAYASYVVLALVGVGS